MFHEVTKIINSSFLFFSKASKFYFHCIFIIYLILFYVKDSVVLTKKKTLFLHDFYVMRPLFWPPLQKQKPTKCLKGDVSLPFL